MPESDSSSPTPGPDHDRQEDIRKVARVLREGGYSYDQSAHLIKKARRRVGLSPPDRSSGGSPERLSTEEQEAFLDAAYDRDGRTGLQMRVLLETGARVSAFVQVRVEDISFRDLEIRLRHTKGDKPRDVPILSSLANELKLSGSQDLCLNHEEVRAGPQRGSWKKRVAPNPKTPAEKSRRGKAGRITQSAVPN